MAKLTQDEIKWILSIDAKGANKEIAVASSEIDKLAQANKIMSADMKDAKKQIKETEKAMEKLAKAGKRDSEAFRELKATRDSARADIDDYTRRIAANSRAISEHKNKIKELNDGMSINEMTMKQLRQRASDLERQLNVTSLSANPKEYKALQKELSHVTNRMEFVGMQGKGLIAQFAGMNHPVGTAAKAVIGFGQALKVLIANPVGIIIMAVATAFMALKKAITSSEENMNRFQQIIAPLKVLFDGLLLIVQKITGAILDFVLKGIKGFMQFSEKIPFIGKYMKEINEKAKEGVELEKEKQSLRVRERESLISNAKKERDIAKLRNKAKQRDKYTNKQIIGFLDQAISLEKQIAQEKIKQAEISLHILQKEAERAQNAEEVNRKIAEQTALITQLQTDFYNKTRRMESERLSNIEEMRREAEAKAKEALERKIAAIDYALKEETKLLKQQLAEQTITKSDYEKIVEQKTLEALQAKLQIAGLEKDARIDIEHQILDAKIKAINLEIELEKKRVEIAKTTRASFMDKDNQELEAIREKFAKRAKELEKAFEKETITELEYNAYKEILAEEQEEELEKKRKLHREAIAAKKLVEQNQKYESEKMILMKQYALGIISKEEYNNRLLALDEKYARRALQISNLSDKEKIAARKKLLDIMVKQQDEETKKQEEAQKKRTQLYLQFSEQIGTMLGGVISGNEDLVKSSLKSIITMALDALEAQVTMSIASATAQSFAQPDAVATFGASGVARAAILTALIKAAFAGVKAVVNSTMSGSKKSNTNTPSNQTTGTRIVTGRQSGGFIDVSRAQDGRRYKALLNPRRRGFFDRPTVLVGDGPAGESMEWVASNDALQNPTIAPFINMLNEVQQAGYIRTVDLNQLIRARMAGFQSGGFIGAPSTAGAPPAEPHHPAGQDSANTSIILSDLRDLLAHLKENGVKSSVNYHEFKQADKKIEDIKAKARRY